MLADAPRTIWFHWRQGIQHMPPVVRACRESWIAQNPDWNVVFVDGRSIWDYLKPGAVPVDTLLQTSEQVYANAIRVRLLAAHGGVWADATTWCRKPLSDWLTSLPGEFFAFASPGPDRMLANWFMASEKESYIARAMADEYNGLFERLGPLKVLPHATTAQIREGVDNTDVFLEPALLTGRGYPYFLFHYLFAFLHRRDPLFRKAWTAAAKISADAGHAAQAFDVLAPVHGAALEALRAADPSVHKLNWRVGAIPNGSLLHAVVSGVV